MSQIVEVTESAAIHVKEMMRHNEEEGSFLRVAVKGGGCSGLTYGMGFETEQSENDLLFTQHDLQVLISNEDAAILKGTIVDYKESLMGGGFTINNPNAIASCGCGTSFTTATKKGTPSEC